MKPEKKKADPAQMAQLLKNGKRPPFRPQRSIPLDEIPGYKEAVAKERLNRLLAFFDVSQTICGFEVMPLTLRRYLALNLCNNPLVHGGRASVDHVAEYLWIMSTHMKPKGSRGLGMRMLKKLFKMKCRMIFGFVLNRPAYVPRKLWLNAQKRKAANFGIILKAVNESIDQAFQDCPKGSGGHGRSYYSGVVSSCGLIAKHFGWSQDSLLDMNMALLFQYANHCRELNAIDIAMRTQTKYRNPLSNPSDEITAQWCIEQGRKNLESQ